MKQMKFLMVAFTLLMGISLTSCLESGDSESPYDWGGYVFVDNSYMGIVTFTDMAGNKLYPSTSSLSQIEGNNSFKVSDYKLAIVYVKLVDKEATPKADESKSYEVNLVGFQGCQYNRATIAQTKADMETIAPETAPIISLSFSDNYGNKTTPYFISKEVVVLPIAFSLEKLDKSIVEKHKLTLVSCMDDVERGSSELVLYLRHDKGTDDKIDKTYVDFYGYNIADAIDGFARKAGAKPTKVVIKSHETGINGGKDMPKEYTIYTLEYKTEK